MHSVGKSIITVDTYAIYCNFVTALTANMAANPCHLADAPPFLLEGLIYYPLGLEPTWSGSILHEDLVTHSPHKSTNLTGVENIKGLSGTQNTLVQLDIFVHIMKCTVI